MQAIHLYFHHSTFDYDAALLQLKTRLKIYESRNGIKPVCLPHSEKMFESLPIFKGAIAYFSHWTTKDSEKTAESMPDESKSDEQVHVRKKRHKFAFYRPEDAVKYKDEEQFFHIISIMLYPLQTCQDMSPYNISRNTFCSFFPVNMSDTEVSLFVFLFTNLLNNLR